MDYMPQETPELTDEALAIAGEAVPKPKPQFTIADLPNVENIAAILPEEKLVEIATCVWDEYKIDKDSRADKELEWDAASQAFDSKREPKSYPFANASNVKFPLLLTAAIQFQSRAMPAVIHDGKVAKGKPGGDDKDGQKAAKANRVGNYMNYQLLDKSDSWADETDKGLLQLPIYGDFIKKIFRDPVKGNRSELVSIRDFVVNAAYPSLDLAPRYTHRFDLYPNQIEERKRDGRYLKVELINGPSTKSENEKETESRVDAQEDKSRPHEFLEQYRLIDLDDDGYEEPYIVTLHSPSRKVVRIVTRYDAKDIVLNREGTEVISIGKRPDFIRYPFIPDPDGGFYSIGFGRLLNDPVAAINTLINQIIDAGNLASAGGGFIGKEFRLKAGTLVQTPGKWQQVTFSGDDIRKSMVPMTHPGPSAVLFEMLGFLIDMAEKITSIQSDALGGETGGVNQTATTTLALIEQGLKVFTGIVGRVLRALDAELKALYNLNGRYMAEDQPEYFTFGDSDQYVMKADFDAKSCDIRPVADASVITDMQKMARAQVIMELAKESPFIDQLEAHKRFLESQGIPIEGLLKVPDPPPQEQVEAMRAELDKLKADTQKAIADAINAMADAEAKGEALDIQRFKAILDGATNLMTAEKPNEQASPDKGTVSGVEGQPGNGGGAPSPEELLAALAPAMGGEGMGGGLPDGGGPAFIEQPQSEVQPGAGMV
jgi:chaperonin GroES